LKQGPGPREADPERSKSTGSRSRDENFLRMVGGAVVVAELVELTEQAGEIPLLGHRRIHPLKRIQRFVAPDGAVLASAFLGGREDRVGAAIVHAFRRRITE